MGFFYLHPFSCMKELLIKWVLNAATLLIGAKLLSGVQISGFGSAMFVAVIIGLLNISLKPILSFFSFPLIFLSLGLFTLVINAAVLMVAAGVSADFKIGGFWNALVLAVLLSIVNSVVSSIFD